MIGSQFRCKCCSSRIEQNMENNYWKKYYRIIRIDKVHIYHSRQQCENLHHMFSINFVCIQCNYQTEDGTFRTYLLYLNNILLSNYHKYYYGMRHILLLLDYKLYMMFKSSIFRSGRKHTRLWIKNIFQLNYIQYKLRLYILHILKIMLNIFCTFLSRNHTLLQQHKIYTHHQLIIFLKKDCKNNNHRQCI